MRRYYRQDFDARLAQFFAPAQAAARHVPARGWGDGRAVARARPAIGSRAAAAPQRPAPAGKDTPYVVVSQQLAASPLHRGHRTAVPRREALILQAALNHPWLLHDHLEELAELEFRHADAEQLKGALIDIAAHAAAARCRRRCEAELGRPRPHRGDGAHRRRDHHPVGLGGAAGGRARTTFW